MKGSTGPVVSAALTGAPVVSTLNGTVGDGGGRKELHMLMVNPGLDTSREYNTLLEMQVDNQTSRKTKASCSQS